MDADARRLRQRSAELRWLATQLDGVPIAALERAAGEDTWHGPAADEFRRDLAQHRRRLVDACTGLAWQARRLDERADQLDVASAVMP